MSYKSGILLPSFANSTTGAAGAAVTVTEAASGLKMHTVDGYEVSIEAAADNDIFTIEIQSNSTTKYRTTVAASSAIGTRIGVVFTNGIEMEPGEAANLVISDPGTNPVITGNLWGSTQP